MVAAISSNLRSAESIASCSLLLKIKQKKGYINVIALGWVLEALHLVLASFLA